MQYSQKGIIYLLRFLYLADHISFNEYVGMRKFIDRVEKLKDH